MCAAMGAVPLILELHGTILRVIGEITHEHYQGLAVAGRRLCAEGRLDKRTKKHLGQLDTVAAMVRHITQPRCDEMVASLVQQLGQKRGKEDDEKHDEVSDLVLEGIPQVMSESIYHELDQKENDEQHDEVSDKVMEGIPKVMSESIYHELDHESVHSGRAVHAVVFPDIELEHMQEQEATSTGPAAEELSPCSDSFGSRARHGQEALDTCPLDKGLGWSHGLDEVVPEVPPWPWPAEDQGNATQSIELHIKYEQKHHDQQMDKPMCCVGLAIFVYVLMLWIFFPCYEVDITGGAELDVGEQYQFDLDKPWYALKGQFAWAELREILGFMSAGWDV